MISNVTLTTKEQYLLQDAKTHEEQCVLKYDNYANLACDEQLKAVFRSNGQKEREHLQTINQLLSGKVPSMGGQGGGNQSSGSQGSAGSMQSQGSQGMSQSQGSGGSMQSQGSGGMSQSQGSGGSSSSQSAMPQSQQSSIEQSSSNSFKASDKDMCIDMLNTEKYVSGSYDTYIFEFKDAQVRDVLNHIQKEEQKHGEAIFSYMSSKGMYNPQ